jgi:hypothetical protein
VREFEDRGRGGSETGGADEDVVVREGRSECKGRGGERPICVRERLG